jgi:hypothetical protein
MAGSRQNGSKQAKKWQEADKTWQEAGRTTVRQAGRQVGRPKASMQAIKTWLFFLQ